jgi:hypothetical protein
MLACARTWRTLSKTWRLSPWGRAAPGNRDGVGRLRRRSGFRTAIQKRSQPRFDWKDGLAGESTPDRVIVPAVEAVDLWELICALTGTETEGYARRQPPAHAMRHGMSHPLLLEKKRT